MDNAEQLGQLVKNLVFLIGGLATLAGILNKYVTKPIQSLNNSIIVLEQSSKANEKEHNELKVQVVGNTSKIIDLDKDLLTLDIRVGNLEDTKFVKKYD